MFQNPGSLAGRGKTALINTVTKALSPMFDTVFGATQGSLLYRGPAAWQALGPGVSGQELKSGGAGANPSWQTPDMELLNTFTVSTTSAALVDNTTLINTNFKLFRYVGYDILFNTNAINFVCYASTNGGSSFFTGAGSYLGAVWVWNTVPQTATGTYTARIGLNYSGIYSLAGNPFTFDMLVQNPASATMDTIFSFRANYPVTGPARESVISDVQFGAATCNALSFGPSAGSWAGVIKAYGIR